MSSRLLRLFVEPPPGEPDALAPPGHDDDITRQETVEFDASPAPAPRTWAAPAFAVDAAVVVPAQSPPGALRTGRRAAPEAEPLDVSPARVRRRSGAHARTRALPRCAVLGTPAAAGAVAAGLALVARRHAGAAAGVVVVVGASTAATAAALAESAPGGEPGSHAATRGARRLAATLGGLGVEATACGRLVWVAVAMDDARGAAALDRVLAAGAPTVLLAASARSEASEAALATCDAIVHVTPAPDSPLATLVAAEAQEPGAPPIFPVAPLGWLSRASARSGRRAPRRLAHLAALCATDTAS